MDLASPLPLRKPKPSFLYKRDTIQNLANKGNGVRLGERAEGWDVTEWGIRLHFPYDHRLLTGILWWRARKCNGITLWKGSLKSGDDNAINVIGCVESGRQTLWVIPGLSITLS